MSKKLFTLLEILLVSVIFSTILVIIFSLYSKMVEVKVYVQAKKYLIENSYFLMENLNVLMKNYTIDYEEYFNRRMVGCNGVWWNDFSWDVGDKGYCRKFTSYGNIGDNDNFGNYWTLYYCSSQTGDNEVIIKENDLQTNFNWCWSGALSNWFSGQWFWEYKQQFRDYGDDIDEDGNITGDYDDIDLWKWPVAVAYNTWVQELYLISKDKRKRVFFRRKLVSSGDFNNDWNIYPYEKWYSIQILRLHWFDAGKDHSFNDTWTAFDGLIDTWACDGAEWFKCSWTSVWGGYEGYNLPVDSEDGWVSITDRKITVSDWNIQIYPPKDPNYAWAETGYDINPYIKIKLKTNLYAQPWQNTINPAILSWFSLELSTTFDMKIY